MNETYGYLGPKATHCEEALYLYLGTETANATAYPSIPQVLTAVSEDRVSHGIVPLENSIEGTVNLTLDLIVSDPQLNIVGEVILPIKHNLLVRSGVSKEEIKLIISHPQALAQCRKYLNSHFPGVPLREVDSTAEAARIVSSGKEPVAAIGNEKAAANYGLEIQEYDIQDCRENQTRFVVISKKETPATKPAKTTLVISITDRPGGLYQILKEFALANINLTKIESRPAKRNLGDYLFFIDLVGHREDPAVKKCLESIEDMAALFRVLGSYPIWGKTGQTENHLAGEGTNLSVEELRQDIDIIDYQIVELLAKRTQLVTLIGTLKNGRDAVRDTRREQEILKRVKKNALKKGVSPELMEKIYGILFDHFVKLQEKQQTGTVMSILNN